MNSSDNKKTGEAGVLFAHTGSPVLPTSKEVRRYLRAFLSDCRVVEKQGWKWQLILNGIILPLRSGKVAAKYKEIWQAEGSPIDVYTRRITQGVQSKLNQSECNLNVVYGMRYGRPSLPDALDHLINKGCSKILLFNLYPQYCSVTSGSNCEIVFSHLSKKRCVPTLKVAEPFYSDQRYLKVQADTINQAFEQSEVAPDRLVLSYHGIPVEYAEKGDPYLDMCEETTRLLNPLLRINGAQVSHSYQSRFGRGVWSTPNTEDLIDQLAGQGAKTFAMAFPGFPCDCLETVDEMGRYAKKLSSKNKEASLELIPCLNDQQIWIDALTEIIKDELLGWL